MYKSGANTVYVNTWTPYMGANKIYSVEGDWYIDISGKAYLHGIDINGNDFLTQHKDNPNSSSDPDNLETRTIKITDAIANAGFGTGGINLNDLTFTPQIITETQTVDIQFTESHNTVDVDGKIVKGILKIEADGQSITKIISMTAVGVYDAGVKTAEVDTNYISSSITNSHSIENGQHYIKMNIGARAKGTYANNSIYYSSAQLIASDQKILANDVYNAGWNAVDSLKSINDVQQIFYENDQGTTDYTKIYIQLENNKTIGNIELPKVNGKTLYQYAYDLGAGQGSTRTATSLNYVINDNGDTDYSRVNVIYDKGDPNTLSITNAFTIGRNSYTNISKEFNSNDTYTPGTNERWNSVKVNVPVRTATVKWTDSNGNNLSYSNDNDSIRYDSNDHSSLVYYTLTYSDGSTRTSSFWVNTYQAYSAGLNSTSQRTATSLTYVMNDNDETDWSRINVTYDDGTKTSGLSISPNAYNAGRNSYTATEKPITSNGTYEPLANERWIRVVVNVPSGGSVSHSITKATGNDWTNTTKQYNFTVNNADAGCVCLYVNGNDIMGAYANSKTELYSYEKLFTISGSSGGSWNEEIKQSWDGLYSELNFENNVSYSNGVLSGYVLISHGSASNCYLVKMGTSNVPSSSGGSPRTGTVEWTTANGSILTGENYKLNAYSASFTENGHYSTIYCKIHYSDNTYSDVQEFNVNTYNAYHKGFTVGSGDVLIDEPSYTIQQSTNESSNISKKYYVKNGDTNIGYFTIYKFDGKVHCGYYADNMAQPLDAELFDLTGGSSGGSYSIGAASSTFTENGQFFASNDGLDGWSVINIDVPTDTKEVYSVVNYAGTLHSGQYGSKHLDLTTRVWYTDGTYDDYESGVDFSI